jgi:DNA-binding XRE family transcriptional regulator
MVRRSNELQIGKAGEYLVCADLILMGFIAFLSEQGLPYDVLLDTGEKLLRVQVKTTTGVRVVPQRKSESKMYIFNIKRHGKNNVNRYTPHEVDLFALVCLETRKVGYLLPNDMPETINIRADELKGTYYDEKGMQDYRTVVELKDKGLTQTQISKQIGIAISTVNRMCAEGYKPFLTGARYFSDFIRSPEWFHGI